MFGSRSNLVRQFLLILLIGSSFFRTNATDPNARDRIRTASTHIIPEVALSFTALQPSGWELVETNSTVGDRTICFQIAIKHGQTRAKEARGKTKMVLFV